MINTHLEKIEAPNNPATASIMFRMKFPGEAANIKAFLKSCYNPALRSHWDDQLAEHTLVAPQKLNNLKGQTIHGAIVLIQEEGSDSCAL